MQKLNPVEFVDKCFIPALFVVAKGDDFVRPHHGELLYEKYAGDKNLIKVEGDHNSERPEFMLDSVSIFFHTVLQCDKLPEFVEAGLQDNMELIKLDEILQKHTRESKEQEILKTGCKHEDEEFK